jgi:hypothetical protein
MDTAPKWHQERKWRLLMAAALLALILIWHAGTLDDALVHVGLNAQPCIKNAYGATFCGNSAQSYCESLPEEGYEARMCQEANDAPLVPPTPAQLPSEPTVLPEGAR